MLRFGGSNRSDGTDYYGVDAFDVVVDEVAGPGPGGPELRTRRAMGECRPDVTGLAEGSSRPVPAKGAKLYARDGRDGRDDPPGSEGVLA